MKLPDKIKYSTTFQVISIIFEMIYELIKTFLMAIRWGVYAIFTSFRKKEKKPIMTEEEILNVIATTKTCQSPFRNIAHQIYLAMEKKNEKLQNKIEL